eukprot:2616508-Rhodomonas_salina.1
MHQHAWKLHVRLQRGLRGHGDRLQRHGGVHFESPRADACRGAQCPHRLPASGDGNSEMLGQQR